MSFAASQMEFAAALTDPARGMPAGIRTVRGLVDPARFNIYRNNVFVGLTNALAARFPVVRRLVGEEFFAGMARIYAGEKKPASPLMFRYGDGFPDFIADFGPAAGLSYLPDVARIEAAWTKAYHAMDVAPLDVTSLSAFVGDTGRRRLVPHASATLVSSPYPAGSIWEAHQSVCIGAVAARPETVLVVRPAGQVSVHVLPEDDASFAQSVFDGATLAMSAERAMALNATFDFGRALVGLTSLGAFTVQDEDLSL